MWKLRLTLKSKVSHSTLGISLVTASPSEKDTIVNPCHLTYLLIYLFFFQWPHVQHMEIPGLGVESELQLLAYAIPTAMPDLSRICDLCHSLQQYQILNPLSEARE